MSEKPMTESVDAETGESIEREMTDQEYADYLELLSQADSNETSQ